MRIGDVATRAGVNTQTLRYYERRGILGGPKRSASGYREYPTDTVRLVRFIKRAQELGFTLTEIEELITLRQTTPKRRGKVRELAAAKMIEHRDGGEHGDGDDDEGLRRRRVTPSLRFPSPARFRRRRRGDRSVTSCGDRGTRVRRTSTRHPVPRACRICPHPPEGSIQR